MANCTITLVDDKDLESEEDFLLRLADPIGFEQCGVRIGELDRTTITIKDHQDGEFWILNILTSHTL